LHDLLRDYCAILNLVLKCIERDSIKTMFNPSYKLTNKILSDLTSIAEAKVIIEKAKILPTQELRLRRQALIRMTQSSIAIEGNILNLEQVEALFKGQKIDAPARYIYEAKNYLKTIKYIEKIVEEKKVITESIILKIHHLVTDKTLPKEKCGKYRTQKVYVVKRALGAPDKVIYTAPDALKVSELIKDLIDWIQNSKQQDIHPILVAGTAHRQFASIHPFVDGNGRVARALSTLILYQRDYNFRKLFALEDYYNKDRQKYYQAISIGPIYHQKDFTKWLEYFIEGFKFEIETVRTKIFSLAALKNNKTSGEQIYLSLRQVQILDFINISGKIIIKDAVDILDCSKRTAQLELQKLKKLKIIEQKGKGPATAYILK